MDYLKKNQESWDKKAEDNYIWTNAASSEMVRNAKKNEWSIVLTPKKPVPKEWFPKAMVGKKVLCLASGGGQQGPIIAALGASVTVLDYNRLQLNQDIMVAQRDNLDIKTIQGDMRDLSMLEDEYFDLIIHPWSNSFVDDILPIWKESYRVLKHGGILLAGFANPIEYIFDYACLNKGELIVRHKIPYSDLTSIAKEELNELVLDKGECINFGHTLHDQIQGQINAGFLIAGFYEDIGGTALDEYINSSIATKAIKF